MRKYIAPQTDIFEVKLENKLMAISGGTDDVNSVSISGSDYDSENVTILSRRGSLWDEEE